MQMKIFVNVFVVIQTLEDMGVSSKFIKSWTFEIQNSPKNDSNFTLNGQLP